MRLRAAFTLGLSFWTLAGAAGAVGAPGPGQGVGPSLLTPVSQTRTVSTTSLACGVDPDADFDAATDFAPWNQEVFSSSACTIFATAQARHDSQILPDRIVANCFSTANVSATVPDSFGVASGEVLLSVTFDVATPVNYALTGWITAFGEGTTNSTVTLVDDNLPPGAGELIVLTAATPQQYSYARYGMLLPGRYTLSALADADVSVACCAQPIEYADYLFDFVLSVPPGTASCFGTGCPCGNDVAGAGCANSTGDGGLLVARGTTSFGADDLALDATRLPPLQTGLFYMGDTQVQNPFFDGLQCALGSTFRFLGSTGNSGIAGAITFGPGIRSASNGVITPGSTWHFHCWYRDAPTSPCGTGANLTNLYSVTYTP